VLSKIYKNLSFKTKKKVRNLYYLLIDRGNYSTYKNYTFSDEDLKLTHILESINYSKVVSLEPIFFEFGCYSARTFNAAIKAYNFLKISNFEIYAFDSFKGLPPNNESEAGIFDEGSFSMSKKDFIKEVKKNTQYSLKDEYIIDGFYEDSLKKNLYNKLKKPSVIHIDVDLYSSANTVLNFLSPLIQVGAVILIDDWYCFKPGEDKGLQRAFREFLIDHPNIQCENWKNYSTFGKSFIINKI